jgi:hypothetical protein
MKSMKAFLKNINIINLLLLAMAIFLVVKLSDSFSDEKIKFTVSENKEVMAETKEKAAAESAITYLDYVVITEKNLFHPKRRMITEETPEQLAKPEIILYGTLITDEKRVAYIEDKKSPYSTPGRGKRQVAVNEGSMVAGYKLAQVNAESILLVRGEDKIIVNLSTQKERNDGEAAAKTTSPATVNKSTPGQMPPSFQPLDKSAPGQMPPSFQPQTGSKKQPYTPTLPPMPARPKLNPGLSPG